MMRPLYWLWLLLVVVACDVSSDDTPISVSDDQQEEEQPPASVNFSLAVLSREDQGDYFLLDVARGESLGGNVNLNLEMNMDRGVVFRVEAEHLIFYRPSFFNRTWIRKLGDGSFRFFEGYFQPEVEPFNVSTLGSSNHILTLYNDAADEAVLLIDLYDTATQEEGTLYTTRTNLDVVLATGKQFILTYQDEASRTQLEAFDLSTRDQVLQTDISSLVALTMVENRILLFGTNVYRSFDFSTGQLGSPVGTIENINRGGLFRATLSGSRLYYPFVYSQPNILLEGPAYFDLDNGTNTNLDVFPLLAELESRGQFFLKPGPILVEPQSETIVMAYSYFTQDNSEEQWALAYLDFDIRLISLVDIPSEPLALMLP